MLSRKIFTKNPDVKNLVAKADTMYPDVSDSDTCLQLDNTYAPVLSILLVCNCSWLFLELRAPWFEQRPWKGRVCGRQWSIGEAIGMIAYIAFMLILAATICILFLTLPPDGQSSSEHLATSSYGSRP